jgi:hypothetical protein
MRDLRRAACLALALAATAAPLAAQTPDQPRLIFTISGGFIAGSRGNLWSLDRQLAIAVASPGANRWDSVALGRQLAPGFAASLSATYFRWPHLGYTAEVSYFGIGTVSSCQPLGPFTLTADRENEQACTYLNGANIRASAVGFLGGLVWRFTRGGLQPYVRALGGFGILGSSYVEEATDVLTTGGGTNLIYFLADRSNRELTWMLSFGAGWMLPLGPGYQLRVEARDVILALPYPTGPAADTAAIAADEVLPQPPIGMRAVQLPTITIGLEVVLERRRGRRY